MANIQIFISDERKEALFEQLKIAQDAGDKEKFKYLLSASHLEQICTGKTYLPDYAYTPLRSQLKKEFKERYNG